MFNFRETKVVPGFRVRDPKEDVPGFRVAPDGLVRRSAVDFLAPTYGRYAVPESWWSSGSPSGKGTATSLALFGGLNGAGSADPFRSTLDDLEPVAAGDLRCQACASGGDYGTTGAYRIENRILCQKCAVKHLGFGNEPSSTQPGLLRPWILDRK